MKPRTSRKRFGTVFIMLAIVTLLAGACGGGGNQAPVIDSISANPETITPSGSTTITCVAFDPDGNKLSYTWSAASGSISGSGDSITWAAPATAGTYEVKVTVDDGEGGTATTGCSVTALANRAPVVNSVTAYPETIAPKSSTVITCTATDPDGGTLTYTWESDWGTFSGTGNVVTWTAPALSRECYIRVMVNDGKGETATGGCTVIVSGNQAPVITSISADPESVTLETSSTITCVATDPDGDPITYAWSAASGGSISGTGSVVTWVAPATARAYPIEVTVSDGRGGATSRSCNVIVLGQRKTITLTRVSNESGCIRSDGTVSSGWGAGDDVPNNVIRAYFSFDLSNLVRVQEIRESKLDFSTLPTGGQPWTNLGGLFIALVDYGARPLEAADYNLPRTSIGTFNQPPITTIDVTSQISSLVSAGETRFQVEAYFNSETNSDGARDGIKFTEAGLTVTYVK